MQILNEYGKCNYCICRNCSAIHGLSIKKGYRRNGHATRLIKQAIKEIRETGYDKDIKIIATPEEDSISKADLVKFYKRMGLTVVDNIH